IADTLLVRLEQRLSTFSLWLRRCCFARSDFRNRSGAFPGGAFYLLPVTYHCWTSISELSMGCSAARDRLFVDLSCAMAAAAAGPFVAAGIDDRDCSFPGFARGFVLAQVPSL